MYSTVEGEIALVLLLVLEFIGGTRGEEKKA
jgi:hypothetical protein